MSVERRQVVIVGAGPVGLLAALGLARQGVEVTVLDSEPEVVKSPRAAVYFHTTISILKKLGLSDEAHAIGLSSTEFMQRVAALAKLPPPHEVTLEQARLEFSAERLSFTNESRRVSNRRLLNDLGLELRYSDIDAGIRASL